MSTQVVRVEGYNKGSLGTIGRECDRADVNHRNQEIEQDLSYFNYSYKDAPHGFVYEFSDIKTALNAQEKETKTGVAFEGMIITADLTFFEELGYEKGKPMPKEVKAFFDRSYEFAKAQIGYQGTDKNILSAKIHLDEKTPHLHLYYVPITEKWQTKIYAKGKDGKVLRSDRGTPLQAKGEDGKTLYEQHEDKTAPKLSRTEFWRMRGGQSSYRMMQDRFQEMVGKQYGLERGEVGSDREHKKTAVFKQEELTAEMQKLAKKIEPLRELQADVYRVNALGKTVLPNIVAIKKKELTTLKEQAKCYSVNRDEIDNIRQRTASVTAQENRMEQWEDLLDNRMMDVERQEQLCEHMYQRQLGLNTLLEQSEKERNRYKDRCVVLERENGSLRAEIEKVRETLTQKIDALTTHLKGAVARIGAVCQAVGMLKHDKTNGYKAELNDKQGRLIDGITNYGSKYARAIGANKMADDMAKYVGISKEIQIEIKKLEPKEKEKDFDFER